MQLFRKKQKDAPTGSSSHKESNQYLLNIITPDGIDYNNTAINIGENFGKFHYIGRFPEKPDYGWLSKLCNLEGTSTFIEFRNTGAEHMEKVMNRRINDMKGNYDGSRNESDKQRYEKAIKDMTKMVKRVTVKEEPVGYVNIMLLIQAGTQQELESRMKRIANKVAVAGGNIRNLKFRQFTALAAASPYGIPNHLDVSNIGERIMPISSFMGGFPMANTGLNDSDGYIIGQTKDGRIIRMNIWLRGKDRTNSNVFVSGVPGVGKSTLLKLIFSMEIALGTKIIVFDPELEYMDLARHPYINGDVIEAMGGGRVRINLLQIRKSPRIQEEDLEEGEYLEDFYLFNDNHGNSDLALYLQQLRTVFSLYFGKEELNLELQNLLEMNLVELYNDHGIDWDTDIETLNNTDYPVLSELYEKLAQKARQEKEGYYKSLYQKLTLMAYSMGEGADSQFWNGYTTLNSDADFINFAMANLMEAGEKFKRAQSFNIASWAWQRMSENREEKVLLGLDEGYMFVDEDYPDLMKFLRNISKRGRKYEAGLMFITHAPADILDEKVRRYGQAIIDNACYKLLLGSDGKNLKETQSLFNLNEREISIISSRNRGQGILMAGGVRMELNVEVTDEFLEMFGKAGGR